MALFLDILPLIGALCASEVTTDEVRAVLANAYERRVASSFHAD